jgi:hypothetical protein
MQQYAAVTDGSSFGWVDELIVSVQAGGGSGGWPTAERTRPGM